MPSNLLAVDTGFPQLTEEQSAEEKFSVITNYLYMLMEQLRYSMANLGAGNFNDAELDAIGKTITAPIYIDLENAAGAIHELRITADQLTSRMEDAEGNISSIEQYAREHHPGGEQRRDLQLHQAAGGWGGGSPARSS